MAHTTNRNYRIRLKTSISKYIMWACVIVSVVLQLTSGAFLSGASSVSDDPGGPSSHPPDARQPLLAAKTKKSASPAHRATPQNLYPPDELSPPGEDYFASYDSEADYPSRQAAAAGADGGRAVNGSLIPLMYDTNGPEGEAIFPNPDTMLDDTNKIGTTEEQETTSPQSMQPDILPDVELPGNWLSDSDLRERDRIDSVEYVYYGSSGRNCRDHSKGRWNAPVLAAAAICCVITSSTGWVLTKKKGFRTTKMFPVEMNLICCLFITNAIMLLGIQDTSVQRRCEVIALLLHYAHLSCAAWISVYCYVVMDNVTRGCVPNLRYNYLFAYGVPAVLVLFFYGISMESYETKAYCWMSLERGMLLGLMFPGTALILSNTLVAMVGLRAASRKRQQGLATNIQARIAHAIARQNTINSTQAGKYTSNNSLVSVESRRTEAGVVSAESKTRVLDDTAANIVEGSSWMLTCATGQIFDTMEHREPSLYRNDSFKMDASNLSMDNLSWKSAEPEGIGDMRRCLNLALVLQPLFCLFWFMGVVAIENANQPLPPFIFAFLWTGMHLFVFYRFSYVLPYIPYATGGEVWTGEVTVTPRGGLADAVVAQGQEGKSTDTIPLLVTKADSPSPAAHTISTITQ